MSTVIKPKRSETALAVPTSGSLATGELAMNVADGKFYTKKTDNSVVEVGGAGSVTLQNVMTNGATTTTDLLLDQGARLVFEGNLANSYETFLTVAEPTADRTITLPNVTGTVITTANLTADGSTTGDPLASEGTAVAYAIALGS
jgi:hypothetical protein